MAKDAFETQQMVRNHTNEVTNHLKDLRNWEKEIKEKEKMIKSESSNGNKSEEEVPLRSDREKFTEYESKIKRSKTVGDELDDEASKNEAETYKVKGNEMFKLCQFESALGFYEKAISLFNREPVFYANAAACYLKLERYEESVRACQKAIEINPATVKAYFRMSQAYEGLGKNVEALEYMNKALKLNPKIEKKEVDRLRTKVEQATFEHAAKILEKKVWLPLNKHQKYINFINKNPNYRSKKPMKRIKIDELQPSMMPTVCDAGEKIPDAVIDKLFNNNTGECTSEPLPSRHSLDFGAFYRRKPKSPPKDQNDDDLDDDPEPPEPTTTMQFYKTWKELSTQKRFVYLKNLSDKPLNKLLGASLDSEILTDILSILSDSFVKNNQRVDNILLELAKNEETSILSLFFNTEDKNRIKNLVNYMNTSKIDPEILTTIKSSFNLK